MPYPTTSLARIAALRSTNPNRARVPSVADGDGISLCSGRITKQERANSVESVLQPVHSMAGPSKLKTSGSSKYDARLRRI